MPVILATKEAEIRRISVQSQPGQIVYKTLSQKYSTENWGWQSGSNGKCEALSLDTKKKKKRKKKEREGKPDVTAIPIILGRSWNSRRPGDHEFEDSLNYSGAILSQKKLEKKERYENEDKHIYNLTSQSRGGWAVPFLFFG
jgi:hypothetical protein